MGGKGVTFWCHLGFVTGAPPRISMHFSTKGRISHRLAFRPILCGFALFYEVYGGEGGIRTPDRVTPMPDFESGAFNRALPPLRRGNSQRIRAIRAIRPLPL